jgi:XTP/dITP diphosphohydrolase
VSHRVVLATRNAHKIEEVRRILAPLVDIELVESPDLAIAETGETFADNALLKAGAVAAATGLPAVADDSGLCVEALNGMPGVLSARWSGRHGDDRANLELLLGQLAEVPDDRRGAVFVCAAALVVPGGESRVVDGRIEGMVTHMPSGDGGFGYDPIFVPRGETRTTAELSAEEKDALSHRGRAFRALAPVLVEVLSQTKSG